MLFSSPTDATISLLTYMMPLRLSRLTFLPSICPPGQQAAQAAQASQGLPRSLCSFLFLLLSFLCGHSQGKRL